MTRTRKQRALLALGRTVLIISLVVVAIAIVGPLTYDEHAHQALDTASHHWSVWGNQLLGFDVTAPRQNIFSLARDLDRTLLIVDHTDVHSSRLLGLTNFITRGSVYFVADALRLFHISLTVRQAKALDLCKPLDNIRENQPIIIQPDPLQYGIASWYGPRFDGRMAASGEMYNMYDLTAAHKTLPLQSIVKVISQRTGRSVVVRINDRGPYIGGRTIDLSYGSKVALGMDDLASIYLERIDPTALDTSCE